MLGELEERLRSADSATYAALLQEFGSANRLAEAQRVHCHIRERGFDGDTFLGNLLVQLYGRCGEADRARRAFDRIAKPDLYSWNIMLQAYSQCGDLENARRVFDTMPARNVISWNAMLSAYAVLGSIEEAEEFFNRMPDRSCASWNALLGAYANNGHLERARSFFERIPCKNVVSWNSMAAALMRGRRKIEALEAFWAMNLQGAKPNAVTFITVLEACVEISRGRTMHAVISSSGLDSHFKIRNALLSMYGRCGDFDRAKEIFDGLACPNVVSWTSMIGAYAQNGRLDQAAAMFWRCPERSVVTWNTMISSYAQRGRPRDAMIAFKRMDLEGEAPNSISFACVLSAASLQETRILHGGAIASNLHKNTAVATALVAAYGRCGSVQESWTVFAGLSRKDVTAWSAMIRALAQNGRSSETLELFDTMVLHGIPPDGIIFVSVLAACSHGGHLARGLLYFSSLTIDYGLERPWRDHYLCLADLVCRSGQASMLQSISSQADVEIFQRFGSSGEVQIEFANIVNKGKIN